MIAPGFCLQRIIAKESVSASTAIERGFAAGKQGRGSNYE